MGSSRYCLARRFLIPRKVPEREKDGGGWGIRDDCENRRCWEKRRPSSFFISPGGVVFWAGRRELIGGGEEKQFTQPKIGTSSVADEK